MGDEITGILLVQLLMGFLMGWKENTWSTNSCDFWWVEKKLHEVQFHVISDGLGRDPMKNKFHVISNGLKRNYMRVVQMIQGWILLEFSLECTIVLSVETIDIKMKIQWNWEGGNWNVSMQWALIPLEILNSIQRFELIFTIKMFWLKTHFTC